MIDKDDVLTLDFETYSDCDITKHGSYVYSLHESTTVLMMSIKFGTEPTTILDVYKDTQTYGIPKLPQRVIDHIKAGKRVIAHNVSFEWAMWKNVCIPKYDWEPVQDLQWFDTMAQCGFHALPLSLDKSTEVLKLTNTKNNEGKALIKLFSCPQKLGNRVLPEHQPESYKRYLQYCVDDTTATYEMYTTLLQPKQHELEVNIPLTFKLNSLGLPVDVESAKLIYPKILVEKESYTQRISELTGGLITTVNQTARMKNWLLKEFDIDMPNFQAGTVEEYLKYPDLPPKAEQLLEMRATGGKSSTGKYERLVNMASPDNRIHSIWIHSGTTTGRVTGRSFQPTNLAKSSVDYTRPDILLKYISTQTGKELQSKYTGFISNTTIQQVQEDLRLLNDEFTSKEKKNEIYKEHGEFIQTLGTDSLIYNLCNKDNDEINEIYGSFMKAASSAIRMLIKAPDGMQLFGADYASIEARVVFWLAGCKRGIKAYENGVDLYKELASLIYNVKYDDVNGEQRFTGKQGILGCSFGLGFQGFINTCANFGVDISESLARLAIDTYRETYCEVPALWNDIEKATMLAMTTGRESFCAQGRISFKLLKLKNNQLFLFMKLPSGRLLAYPQAKIEIVVTPWGAKKKAVTFRKFVDNQWRKESTYGGKLVENAVQAIARDIMYAGMHNVQEAGFEVIMQV